MRRGRSTKRWPNSASPPDGLRLARAQTKRMTEAAPAANPTAATARAVRPVRARTSLARSLRLVHYWASIFLVVTTLVVAVTGILLALKKDFDTLQPPVAQSSAPGLSELRVSQLLADIRTREGFEGITWREIDRIDIQPADGIAKVILSSRTEFQVDLQTGKVLQTGYRTSDFLESVHDFSFVGRYGKYLLSVPTGIALLVVWLTGTYLFIRPFLVRRRRRRRH